MAYTVTRQKFRHPLDPPTSYTAYIAYPANTHNSEDTKALFLGV